MPARSDAKQAYYNTSFKQHESRQAYERNLQDERNRSIPSKLHINNSAKNIRFVNSKNCMNDPPTNNGFLNIRPINIVKPMSVPLNADADNNPLTKYNPVRMWPQYNSQRNRTINTNLSAKPSLMLAYPQTHGIKTYNRQSLHSNTLFTEIASPQTINTPIHNKDIGMNSNPKIQSYQPPHYYYQSFSSPRENPAGTDLIYKPFPSPEANMQVIPIVPKYVKKNSYPPEQHIPQVHKNIPKAVNLQPVPQARQSFALNQLNRNQHLSYQNNVITNTQNNQQQIANLQTKNNVIDNKLNSNYTFYSNQTYSQSISNTNFNHRQGSVPLQSREESQKNLQNNIHIEEPHLDDILQKNRENNYDSYHAALNSIGTRISSNAEMHRPKNMNSSVPFEQDNSTYYQNRTSTKQRQRVPAFLAKKYESTQKCSESADNNLKPNDELQTDYTYKNIFKDNVKSGQPPADYSGQQMISINNVEERAMKSHTNECYLHIDDPAQTTKSQTEQSHHPGKYQQGFVGKKKLDLHSFGRANQILKSEQKPSQQDPIYRSTLQQVTIWKQNNNEDYAVEWDPQILADLQSKSYREYNTDYQ